MTREQLEHLIRVCAEITEQHEFVVVGSQSILGQVPNPPAAFTVSMEADMYPLAAPELAEQIEGAIGEGSHFQATHGYYASGVGPDTATLPEDWMTRAHRIQNSNTDLKVGWCLDMKDLFLAKAVAGRLPKDRAFCMALLEHGYVTPGEALPLVDRMPLDNDERKRLRATIRRWVKALRDSGTDIAD